MKLKVYEYKNCGTCKKALKFLESKQIEIEKIPIRETPPSLQELKKMLFYTKNIKKLFNTSGGDYKDLNLKEKLPGMSEDDQLKLLASNGNLIKRPFVITQEFGLIGFQEEEWKKLIP